MTQTGELPQSPLGDGAPAPPSPYASTLLARVASLSAELKRELLGLLRLDELRAVATRIGVAVHDASAEGDLINAIIHSRAVTLNAIVPVLSRARRDDVCRALGLAGRAPEGCVIAEVGGHR